MDEVLLETETRMSSAITNFEKRLVSIRTDRVNPAILDGITVDYYINKIIYGYIIQNEIEVKLITTDNGIEFNTLEIYAKRLGVMLSILFISKRNT